MNEEIRIDISATGDVTVEGVNIEGPHCVALTKEIEEALGERQKMTKKAEFHRTVTTGRKLGR